MRHWMLQESRNIPVPWLLGTGGAGQGSPGEELCTGGVTAQVGLREQDTGRTEGC